MAIRHEIHVRGDDSLDREKVELTNKRRERERGRDHLSFLGKSPRRLIAANASPKALHFLRAFAKFPSDPLCHL